MISNIHDRVRAHTSPEILERIDRETEERVRFFASQSNGMISARIVELEQEWDIERWFQTNGSALAFTGLALGLTVSRKWLWLTGGILAFLLQQATQGWCPPLPALRRAGVRTRSEIQREIYALKALRGDFETIAAKAENNQLLRASDVLRAVTV